MMSGRSPPSRPHPMVSSPPAPPLGVCGFAWAPGLLASLSPLLCGGASGVRHLLRYAVSPSLSLSAPACHPAEAAILADLSHAVLLYLHWIGCSAANKPTQVCLQLFVNSCIVILIAIATTLEVTFPVFRCRWCLCRCGIAVALVHSRSIALTPDASSPLWLEWWVPFRCEPCFATCRRKNKDNHAKHDIVPAAYVMFEMGSCPACRSITRVRGNVTPKIPDCHEDHGPNHVTVVVRQTEGKHVSSTLLLQAAQGSR